MATARERRSDARKRVIDLKRQRPPPGAPILSVTDNTALNRKIKAAEKAETDAEKVLQAAEKAHAPKRDLYNGFLRPKVIPLVRFFAERAGGFTGGAPLVNVMYDYCAMTDAQLHARYLDGKHPYVGVKKEPTRALVPYALSLESITVDQLKQVETQRMILGY